MKTPSIATITVFLPEEERDYEFRIPSVNEIIQLREEFEILDFVLERPPFFDWVAQRLIYKIEHKRADTFDFDDVDDGDAQIIRREVRVMVTGLLSGKCCVCGGKTTDSSIVVCGACTLAGWQASASINNLRTDLGISRVVKTSRWALRGDTVSFLTTNGTIQTISMTDIDIQLRGFRPPGL